MTEHNPASCGCGIGQADARPPDFVVLHPDGRVDYRYRTGGQSINDAIRPHITDLATQRLGNQCRMWFHDRFMAEMPRNDLADRVIPRLGYTHQSGWCGVVAVTMEEDFDGTVTPLTPNVRALIDQIARQESQR